MTTAGPTRRRALCLVTTLALTAAAVVLAAVPPPALADSHDLCVSAEGNPSAVGQADILEVCAEYEESELAFSMRVSEPTDPQTDPNWQGDTQLSWVFDTFASTHGTPNGQLAVRTVDGGLRTVATIFDHTTPVCIGEFSFDGQWYHASFDPRCLDLPPAITFAGHVQYDTNPEDTGDFASVHSDRLPRADEQGPDAEGPLAGPVSSDGWSCPALATGELESAGFADRLAVPAAHRLNVDCAAQHGIVSGFADNAYRPGHAVRRDQMAAFVARTLDAAGVDLPAADGRAFTDVTEGSTHDEAIHRLAAAGIVQGGPGGLPADAYGPALAVRRDQMVSFIVRAAEYVSDVPFAAGEQAFADVPPNNAHFDNVNAAAREGLVQGHADGTLRPAGPVRRDQTASFSVRLLGWVLASGGQDGEAEVSVFFSLAEHSDESGDVFAVSRVVQRPAVLRGALDELLRGPTEAEREEGYWSWFSEDTAGMVRSVHVSDGTAFVDFDDFSEIIPNASTSHGAGVLLAQLGATATQFRSVERARYAFEGDEAAFYEWLQVVPPPE